MMILAAERLKFIEMQQSAIFTPQFRNGAAAFGFIVAKRITGLGDAQEYRFKGQGPKTVMARLVRATYSRTYRDRWPGQAKP